MRLEIGGLSRTRAKRLQDGRGPMREGHVALLIILAPVEIVNWATLEQPHGEAPDLIRRSVVDLQLLAAAPDVDAALAQGHPMAVDPLVGIADDEKIVLSG